MIPLAGAVLFALLLRWSFVGGSEERFLVVLAAADAG